LRVPLFDRDLIVKQVRVDDLDDFAKAAIEYAFAGWDDSGRIDRTGFLHELERHGVQPEEFRLTLRRFDALQAMASLPSANLMALRIGLLRTMRCGDYRRRCECPQEASDATDDEDDFGINTLVLH